MMTDIANTKPTWGMHVPFFRDINIIPELQVRKKARGPKGGRTFIQIQKR